MFKLVTRAMLFPVLFVLVWYFAVRFNLANSYLVPSPAEVMQYIVESVQDKSLLLHIWASLRRVFGGFALAAVIAVPFGMFYGASKIIRQYTFTMLEFMRHIPPLALLSILILTFGIGEASKIAIIFLASFFPIFVNCADGIANVDQKLIEVGNNFGLRKKDIYLRIALPYAFPNIITGLQLGMGYSFRALVGAEMIAAASGLGYMIRDAEVFARSDIIFAGIIVLGVIGILIDYIFIFMIKRFVRYKAAI